MNSLSPIKVFGMVFGMVGISMYVAQILATFMNILLLFLSGILICRFIFQSLNPFNPNEPVIQSRISFVVLCFFSNFANNMQKLLELYKKWSGAEPQQTEKLAGAGSNREYYRLTAADGTSVVGCVGTSRD